MIDLPANNQPRLRALDIRPLVHFGRPSLYLRDPLQLSDRVVVLPRELGPLLMLCDGTRDASALRASLLVRYGLPVSREVVERVVSVLDEAFLLVNPRFNAACAAQLAAYRAAPFRPPALAGSSYPADPTELNNLFDAYQAFTHDVDPGDPDGRGLVSPHIDYERGGAVYARVWKRAAAAVRAADLVVIFGTDHYGDRLINLTRQHYATPWGVLPTAVDVVDTLAGRLGAASVFDGELRHRTEHSIELTATWLHYTRGMTPVEVLPVLCGSFHAFLQNRVLPEEDDTLGHVVEVLTDEAKRRRVVVVAAGDLAHVGPAFGGAPVYAHTREDLHRADQTLIDRMCAGDAGGFFGAIHQIEDCNNVCGVAPIYLTLRLLAPTHGEAVAYDTCPADENATSWVSICGVTLA